MRSIRFWALCGVHAAVILGAVIVVLGPRFGDSGVSPGQAPTRGGTNRHSEKPPEVGSGRPEEDHVLQAIETIRKRKYEFPTPQSVVDAFRVCGRAKDPRAAPTLIDAITLQIWTEEMFRLGDATGSGDLDPGDVRIGLSALIQMGDPAVPYIIAALSCEWPGKPPTRRESSLLRAFAAILGPFDGVKRLERAIQEAEHQWLKWRLQITLKQFRNLGYVTSWLPEGEGNQRFTGNVREELEKHPELWKDAD